MPDGYSHYRALSPPEFAMGTLESRDSDVPTSQLDNKSFLLTLFGSVRSCVVAVES